MEKNILKELINSSPANRSLQLRLKYKKYPKAPQHRGFFYGSAVGSAVVSSTCTQAQKYGSAKSY